MNDENYPEAGPSSQPYDAHQSTSTAEPDESVIYGGEAGQGEVLYYVDEDGNRVHAEDMHGQVEQGDVTMKEEQSEDAGQVSMLEPQEAALPDTTSEGRVDSRHQEEATSKSIAEASSASFPPPPIPPEPVHAPPDYVVKYQLTGHRKHISAVKFSPDGKWLATAGADGRILLFSLSADSAPSFIRAYTTPAPPKPKPIPTAPQLQASAIPAAKKKATHPPIGGPGLNDLCFSPDSKSLAAGGDDKLVRVWRLGEYFAGEGMSGIGTENTGTSDGKEGVTGAAEGASGCEQSESAAPHSAAKASRFVREDSVPLSGPDPSDQLLSRLFSGHTSFVFCLAYSPTGSLLASGSFDETVKLWDISTGKLLRTLPAHSDPVSGIAFSRDGTILCSTGHDGLLRLWDATTGQCLKTLVDVANPPASFCLFTPNSSYILTSSLDSTLRLWDYHSATCVKTYTGHKNLKYHIGSAFWVPPSMRATKQLSDTVNGQEGAQRAETYVIAGSEDGRIWFWELQSRRKAFELQGHEEAVLCIALDSQSGMLATASLDAGHTVKIWVDRSRTKYLEEVRLRNEAIAAAHSHL